jgi:hypothetical protein
MSSRAAFEAARREITFSTDLKSSLCSPFLSVFPVTGVAVSVLATPAGQKTMCASDDLASRIDELQFDLGEGPCWDAMSSRAPVVAERFDSAALRRWPLLAPAIPLGRVSVIYAFPLVVGALEIGAVDMYCATPQTFDAADLADASELTNLTAWQVLRRLLADEDAEAETPYSRREVHQATGMVLAQLDISAEDAVLLIRAHAFSSGRPMREVSNDIVERRLSFSSDQD